MLEILGLLREDLFEVIIFGDECILETPIENWPFCEALIAFYSKNFPLEKAVRYAELRKPLLLNDLKMQFLLQSRCKVYEVILTFLYSSTYDKIYSCWLQTESKFLVT